MYMNPCKVLFKKTQIINYNEKKNTYVMYLN